MCKNPCLGCSLKYDCVTENIDKRHECQAFIKFQGEIVEDAKKPCAYCGEMTNEEFNDDPCCHDCKKKFLEDDSIDAENIEGTEKDVDPCTICEEPCGGIGCLEKVYFDRNVPVKEKKVWL
jgi:hypothetical protein